MPATIEFLGKMTGVTAKRKKSKTLQPPGERKLTVFTLIFFSFNPQSTVTPVIFHLKTQQNQPLAP
jgi:hypothetical protein